MLSNVLEKFVPFLYNEDVDLDNPQGDIMIEFWTDTAGQDVVIELEGICGTHDLYKKLYDWWDRYDAEEEFELWYPMHGKRGVPDSPYTLLQDLEEVGRTVYELLDDIKREIYQG